MDCKIMEGTPGIIRKKFSIHQNIYSDQKCAELCKAIQGCIMWQYDAEFKNCQIIQSKGNIVRNI